MSASLHLPDLRAALVDNAVARKDALVLSRQRGAVVGLALALVAALATTGAVLLAMLEAVDGTLYRPVLVPHGRSLTAAIAGVALALATLLVPARASMTIVSERESGTLRLLLTTALTPTDIVLGKALAVLQGVAAPLLLALPLMAGGALFGAVSVVDVLLGAGLLLVNVVALISVGVAASATSGSVRVAPGAALGLAILLVGAPVGLPSLILFGVWADGGYRPELLPGVLIVVAWAVVVTVGSLLIARDALGPSSPGSRAGRRWLVTAALVGTPVLAAASLVGLRSPVEDELWGGLYLLGFGGLALVVVLVEVCLRGPLEGGAWRAAARSTWALAGGAIVSLPVAWLCFDAVSTSGLRVDDVGAVPLWLACVVPVGLWLTLTAAIAAASVRRASTPVRRVVGTVGVVLALWFVPALLRGATGLGLPLPRVDPVTLIAFTTAGVVEPFDVSVRDRASWEWALGISLVAFACAALGVSLMALWEKLRERVLARR